MELASKRAPLMRLANLALLIGGFGLGQGSIFIAQTYLVATGKMDLLANFGTHFSFAMLGIIAVEAGSLTVLARQASHLVHGGGQQREVWRSYWETTTFRLSMAAVIVAAIILYCLSGTASPFSINYALTALPAFVIWAFNAAGFLDGLKKSGISGITGSLAYIVPAAGLILCSDLDAATAGLILGSALSLGYLVTVVAQYVGLAASGWKPMLVAPTSRGVRQAFHEETAMLAGLLPGQFYFRIQLALCTLFLGLNATALLVYAKQIVGACGQISGFVRRTEFPDMTRKLSADAQTPTPALLAMQKASLGCSGLLMLIILLTSLVLVANFGGFTREAWLLLALFCLTISSESVGQSLVQILFAHGLFASAALIRILAVIIGVSFASLFIRMIGINVFVFADLCSHATVITLSALHLRNRARLQ